MQDNLEQFIQQHRDAFDTEAPRAHVWDRVDEQINGKGNRSGFTVRRILSIAASIVFLLLAGGYIGMEYQKQREAVTTLVMPAELVEVEESYRSRINVQLARLSEYGYTATVEPDLEELEHFLVGLKQELEATPEAGREDVVQAIISNYKARLEILYTVLQKLKEESTNHKSKKSNHDESIDI